MIWALLFLFQTQLNNNQLRLPKMPAAFVQGTSGRGVSPKSVSFGTNTIAGNLIVVGIVVDGNAAILSVVDGVNTYTRVDQILSVTGQTMQVWFAPNIAGGPVTVTVTFSAFTINFSINEYSGVSAVDAHANSTNIGVDPSIPLTTSQNNELLFGLINSPSSNPSAGTGFTGRSNTGTGANTFYLPEDNVTNTAGSNLIQFVCGTIFNGMIVVAFKPASPPTTVAGRRTFGFPGTRTGSRQMQ